MLDDFAKRLKELRSSKKMTMGEFGDLGDVSATTQGTYEREDPDDRRYPDVRYLYNLKNHGIDIHYLLTGEKSPEDVISAKAMEIIRAYESADDNHKAIFEATAKACAVKPKGRVDKKKDDQDPPKSGSKQKIGDITTGDGSIGDIMNDSIKKTTHNYNITDNRTKLELDLNWEDASEKIDSQEDIVRRGSILIILAGLILFMGEMLSHTTNPTNELEQLSELFYLFGIPMSMAFFLYREISKKITFYFKNKRKRVKRDIYLG